MAKLQETGQVAKTSSSKVKKGADDVVLIKDPRPEDILCGKEKHCVSHQGSLNFRKIIESYAAEYQVATTKNSRMAITKRIYDQLGSQNARFLKYNSKLGGWEELSSLLARDKCSHALRFANRERKTAGTGASSPSAATKSKTKRGHRRTGSDSSSGSNSTLTTVASELSFDECELMDDEPLEWKNEAESPSASVTAPSSPSSSSLSSSSSSSSSEHMPYVYEVPYDSAPPPSAYHPYGPHYYPYQPYGHPHSPRQYDYYYNHPSYHYYGPPSAPSYHEEQQQYHEEIEIEIEQEEPPMVFPEKPHPAPPARESSMDVDLTYMMSEPLMEWDLDTEEVREL